jgi:hypothetical protein
MPEPLRKKAFGTEDVILRFSVVMLEYSQSSPSTGPV